MDNLVRELSLAEADHGGHGPPRSSAPWSRRSCTASGTPATPSRGKPSRRSRRGEQRTSLTLQLPLSAAEAAEAYLAALDEADTYSRAARLLTLETPPDHKLFRRWYVEAVVRQLRDLAAGREPERVTPFADLLVGGDPAPGLGSPSCRTRRTAAAGHRSTRADPHARGCRGSGGHRGGRGAGCVRRRTAGSRAPTAGTSRCLAPWVTRAVWCTRCVKSSSTPHCRRRPRCGPARRCGWSPGRSGTATSRRCAGSRPRPCRCAQCRSRWPGRFWAHCGSASTTAGSSTRTNAASSSPWQPRPLRPCSEPRSTKQSGARPCDLQRALLPADIPRIRGWDVATHYSPAGDQEAGGDFYDVLEVGGGRYVAVVGDVMGRGLDAAASMAQVRSTSVRTPWRIPTRSRCSAGWTRSSPRPGSSSWSTMVYLLIDPVGGTVQLANAGHMPPLLVGVGGAWSLSSRPSRRSASGS